MRTSAWCLEHKNPITGNLVNLYVGKKYCNGREEVAIMCGLHEAIPFEDERSAFIFLAALNQKLVEVGKDALENILPTEHIWVDNVE